MEKEIDLDLIEKNARVLQKKLCVYGTTEGDNRVCDCKFSRNGDIRPWTSSEESGCAEAREIIWEIKKLKKHLHE